MMPERSPLGPKPYPHRCAECGKISVHPVTIDYDAKVKHDGKLHEFHIASLDIDQCANCGERFFINSTDEQISAALRAHVGLLRHDLQTAPASPSMIQQDGIS